MATLKFAGFLLFGVLCFGAGVFSLTRGDLGALGMFGFGVVCVAGAFLTREPKAPEEPLLTGSITAHGRTFTGLVITFSQRRAVLAVLIGIGFVAAGIWIAVDRNLLVGIACTALFAAMTVLGLVGVLKGAGRLVLTEDELAHVGTGGYAAMRWDEVSDVARFDIRGAPFLRLDSPGGAEFSGAIVEVLAAITRRSSLDIPLSAVGVDPDWLEDLIVRCVDDPRERARVASEASAAPDALPAASA